MSITRSEIVLALCVLSQTVQGAEVRRVAPSGQLRATTPQVTVKRTPSVTHDHRGVSFADASKAMAPYKQWMIGANKTGFVLTKRTWSGPADRNYNLKGTVIRKFLQYEKQGTWQGINLGWTKNASAQTATARSRWFVRRPWGKYTDEKGANAVPLKYGERLALAWGAGDKPFIKYAKRNVGINLDWSKGPLYEWAILGGKPGDSVKRGEDFVIIYNLKHKRPLMYFDRTVGGDIGWPDSTRWGTGALILKNNVTMDNAVKTMLAAESGTWTYPDRNDNPN